MATVLYQNYDDLAYVNVTPENSAFLPGGAYSNQQSQANNLVPMLLIGGGILTLAFVLRGGK